MNLRNLPLPKTYSNMKITYNRYYYDFYHEMVRMSNTGLADYVETFIKMISEFTKSPLAQDIYRAGVGITALHQFGFRDFNRLAYILDRILPQRDPALVSFTSWCVGKLIHHPGNEQAKYCAHLIHRVNGWLHAHGRRERHLAAASLLKELSSNAGICIVIYLNQIEAAANILVTHPSFTVLDCSVKAYSKFTTAMIRYRRSDLNSYLEFIYNLCYMLLSCDNPDQKGSALLLLSNIMKKSPEYFVASVQDITRAIDEAYDCSPLVLKASCVSTDIVIASVDKTQWYEFVAADIFDRINEVVLEFPEKIVVGLINLISYVPKFVNDNINEYKKIVEDLIKNEILDEALMLLAVIIKNFPDTYKPFDAGTVKKLSEADMTKNYKKFFVELTKHPEATPDNAPFVLVERIEQQLKSPDPLMALKLIAELPRDFFPPDNDLLKAVQQHASSESVEIRAALPRAIFNIADSLQKIDLHSLVMQEMQRALSDHDIGVRISILESIGMNCPSEIAKPDSLRLFRAFVNDDAATVRQCSLRILSRIARANPIMITGIVRQCILDYFYILKNVSSVRQRARIARILPTLIKASESFISVYTSTFIEIFLNEMDPEKKASRKYSNFIEENSANQVMIGFVNSLELIAPMDPKKITAVADQLITALCLYLQPTSSRELCLAILSCFLVFLSPPTSTITIRAQCANILSACSHLLNVTNSRKVRIDALKVIGAIGVIDVHQPDIIPWRGTPENIDEKLARNFFEPNRDADIILDDSMLLEKNGREQYFGICLSQIILQVFDDPMMSDLYVDAAKAMMEVVGPPRGHVLAYYDMFVKKLLNLLRKSPEETLPDYIRTMTMLISHGSSNITSFKSEIIAVAMERINEENDVAMLECVLALIQAVRDAFSPDCNEIICLLLDMIDSSKTKREDVCKVILEIFAEVGKYSEDQLFLIVNQIVDCIICNNSIHSIRVMALQALEKLTRATDLMPFVGIIIRAISYSLFEADEEAMEAAIELMTVMIATYGDTFKEDAESMSERMREKGIMMEKIVDAADRMKKESEEKPRTGADRPKVVKRAAGKKEGDFMGSEDIIVSKATNPNLGEEHHLELWLLSLIHIIISTSPRPAIRACAPLANSSEWISYQLFKPAFLCSWWQMSDQGKSDIMKGFQEVLTARENYEKVGREIINLIQFLHKINEPMKIPYYIIVNACLKYQCYGFALKLQEESFESKPDDLSVIKGLVTIYTELGQRDNAVTIQRQCQSTTNDGIDILAKLQLWEKCVEPYRQAYERRKDWKSLVGLAQSLAALSEWKQISDLLPDFQRLNRKFKTMAAEYFAEACLHLGQWDKLDDILDYAPNDSDRCNIMAALNALNKRDFERVNECLEHGFSLIASRPISFLVEHQKLHQDTVYSAQRLIEVAEMKEWLADPSTQRAYEDLWLQRMRTAPRDFELWFDLIANRQSITKLHNDFLIKFFELKSPTPNTKAHSTTFDILFPNHNFETAGELEKICYVVAQWSTGNKKFAIEMMKNLVNECHGSLRVRARLLYATWLMELDESLEGNKIAYENLQEVYNRLYNNKSRSYRAMSCEINSPSPHRSGRISRVSSAVGSDYYAFTQAAYRELTVDVEKVEVMRRWAFVSSELIGLDPKNSDEYVTRAIECLTECTRLSPSFSDVVQLLNLFFDFASRPTVFEKTEQSIRMLPIKLLLQASPQILVQLSHGSPNVAMAVHNLVFHLMTDHYHGLVFSLMVMQSSANANRQRAAKNILDEFAAIMPSEANEVFMIQDAMLRVAVTRYELVIQYLLDIGEGIKEKMYHKVEQALKRIEEAVATSRCALEEEFNRKFNNFIEMLPRLVSSFDPTSPLIMNQLRVWRENFEQSIDANYNFKYIMLNAISTDLVEKTHFKLAVPGTYKPFTRVIPIRYWVGQLSVYASKQQPKGVLVKGEDGNFYQYLLKGHEDLRLDERIMQFFRLVNSFLKKESIMKANLIQLTCVIPLSNAHGLVQWVPGTDTLKALVEQYRGLMGRDALQEYTMMTELSAFSYDQMQPVQKMQIISKIFNEVPDTDIANFFWIKAGDAEKWMKMTTAFSISTAVTSAIGYIIGLGDRHPSNLLIDRFTGKVVHIDFGDCFERAMQRKVLPEVVPFRLTRMMVKAMGVTGTEGTFKKHFVDMLTKLRENGRILILILAIFVHEPLNDPEDSLKHQEAYIGSAYDNGKRVAIPRSDSMSDEIRLRVRQKLTGHDFGSKGQMGVEEQAQKLIDAATSRYNLAKMFHGWCPFW